MNLQTEKVLFKNFRVNYLSPLLGVLLLTLGTISCDCGSNQGGAEESLTMQVEPTKGLLGDSQLIQVNFKLNQNSPIANLTKYRLKVSLATKGTAKAALLYQGTGKEQLIIDTVTEQQLAYFSANPELTRESPSLQIHFNLETKPGVTYVDVKFELLDESGRVVKEAISSWAGSDKPVDLKLERIGYEILKGDKSPFEIKITNRGKKKTEANQLRLKIVREKGDKATIVGAEQGDGTYFLDLPETIDASGAYITKELLVNLGTDPEAIFKLKLFYEGKEHGGEVIVACKGGTIEIEALPKRFIGDHVVEFSLFNNSEVDVQTSDFTLELVSDNNAVFQFMIEKNPTGNANVRLEEVYRDPVIKRGEGFGGLQFRINNPNGESKAEVIVKLRKGTEEVTSSEKVVWEAKGMQLELRTKELMEGYILADDIVGELELVNVGDTPISTDDIYVIFTNSSGLNFKLGTVSRSSNIHNTLSGVLGSTSMLKEKVENFVLFYLKLTSEISTIDVYGADLKLEFRDKGNNLLIEKKLAWLNQAKLVRLVQNTQLTEISKKLADQRTSDLEAVRYDPGHIPAFYERTIATFRLRQEAESIIPTIAAKKNNLKEILAKDRKVVPDFVKIAIQAAIDAPDNALMQEIDQNLLEDFGFVNETVFEILEKVSALVVRNDKIEAQRQVEVIKKWADVVGRFVIEIGTSEAKELAEEVNKYKAEAEALLKQ